MTEPPVTLRLSLDEIKSCIQDPDFLKMRQFPADSQGCERFVQRATRIVGTKTRTKQGLEQHMSNAIFAWSKQETVLKRKGDWVPLSESNQPASSRKPSRIREQPSRISAILDEQEGTAALSGIFYVIG